MIQVESQPPGVAVSSSSRARMESRVDLQNENDLFQVGKTVTVYNEDGEGMSVQVVQEPLQEQHVHAPVQKQIELSTPRMSKQQKKKQKKVSMSDAASQYYIELLSVHKRAAKRKMNFLKRKERNEYMKELILKNRLEKETGRSPNLDAMFPMDMDSSSDSDDSSSDDTF